MLKAEPTGDTDKYARHADPHGLGHGRRPSRCIRRKGGFQRRRPAGHSSSCWIISGIREARSGWFWKVRRDGQLDRRGQTCLWTKLRHLFTWPQYTLSTGDRTRVWTLPRSTFDLLQTVLPPIPGGAAITKTWKLTGAFAPLGFAGGDRKSLDIHMHLMEAFTTLSQASGKEIHSQKAGRSDRRSSCNKNDQPKAWMRPEPLQSRFHTDPSDRHPSAPGMQSGQPGKLSKVRSTAPPTVTTLNSPGFSIGPSRRWACRKIHYAEIVTRSLVDHSLKYGFDHTLRRSFSEMDLTKAKLS